MTGIEELAAAAFAAIPEGAGTALASAATAAAVGSALQPKAPGVKPPTPMPDQQSVDAARRRSLVEQMSRRGRASTILSDPTGDNTLG